MVSDSILVDVQRMQLDCFGIDPRQFNRYDTNRDGLVDAPEYAQGEREEHRRKSTIE